MSSLYLAAKTPSCFLLPSPQRTGRRKIRLKSFSMQQTWLEGCGQSMTTPICSSFILMLFSYCSVVTDEPWPPLTAPTRPWARTTNTSDFQIFLRPLKSTQINCFLRWLYFFKRGWWKRWYIPSWERYIPIIKAIKTKHSWEVKSFTQKGKVFLCNVPEFVLFYRCLTEQDENTMGEESWCLGFSQNKYRIQTRIPVPLPCSFLSKD